MFEIRVGTQLEMAESNDDIVLIGSQDMFSTPLMNTPAGNGNKRKKDDMTPSPNIAENKKGRTLDLNDSQSFELRLSQESQSQKSVVTGNVGNDAINLNEIEISQHLLGDGKKTNSQEQDDISGENNKDMDSDKEMCSLCQKEANQGTLQCDACKRWYHNECVKLKKEQAKMIGKLHELVKWFCNDCNQKIECFIEGKDMEDEVSLVTSVDRENEQEETLVNNQGSEVVSWNEYIDKLNEETRQAFKIHDIRMQQKLEETEETCIKILDKFEERVADMEEKYRQILVGANIDSTNHHIDNRREGLVREENIQHNRNKNSNKRNSGRRNYEELIEYNNNTPSNETNRESSKAEIREKNLVIYNMYESDLADVNKRIEIDTKNIEEMLHFLEIRDCNILKVSRLGQKRGPDDTRPLLGKFASETQKWVVLSQGNYLKESEMFYNIFLAKDMSKDEQQKNKNLRNELITRRNNGEDIKIKNGRIYIIKNRI